MPPSLELAWGLFVLSVILSYHANRRLQWQSIIYTTNLLKYNTHSPQHTLLLLINTPKNLHPTLPQAPQ